MKSSRSSAWSLGSKTLIFCTTVLCSMLALGQSSDMTGGCQALQGSALQPTIELCSKHDGCKVIAARKRWHCGDLNDFYSKLRDRLGDGEDTLLGKRIVLTASDVFEAALSPLQRTLDQAKEVGDARMEYGLALGAQDRETKTRMVPLSAGPLLSTSSTGATALYYGPTSGDKAEGYGVRIWSDGEMQRGRFRNGVLEGVSDVVFPDGTRAIGERAGGGLNGGGAKIDRLGMTSAGQFLRNEFSSGRRIRSNGDAFFGNASQGGYSGRWALSNGTIETGSFDLKSDTLQVGTRQPSGGQIENVDVPGDRSREAATQAAAREEASRKQAEAAGVANRLRQEAENAAVRANQERSVSAEVSTSARGAPQSSAQGCVTLRRISLSPNDLAYPTRADFEVKNNCSYEVIAHVHLETPTGYPLLPNWSGPTQLNPTWGTGKEPRLPFVPVNTSGPDWQVPVLGPNSTTTVSGTFATTGSSELAAVSFIHQCRKVVAVGKTWNHMFYSQNGKEAVCHPVAARNEKAPESDPVQRVERAEAPARKSGTSAFDPKSF